MLVLAASASYFRSSIWGSRFSWLYMSMLYKREVQEYAWAMMNQSTGLGCL